MNKNTLIMIVVIFACLALGLFGVIYLQQILPDVTGKSGSDNSTKSLVRCEEVVRASLIDADRAQFRNQKVTSLGNDRYQIVGSLDAPNASGIMLKGNYNCIFNFKTKAFDLLSLEGDDIWKPLKR